VNIFLTYVFRRVFLHFFPVLFGISIVVFGIIRMIPGDTVDMLTDRMTFEQKEIQRKLFGFDQPLVVQYGQWMGNVVQGNLGVSLRSGNNVVTEITQVVPATVQLGVFGGFIGILLGVFIGIVSAVRQDTLVDKSLRFVAYLGISLPEFWLGTLLILLFSVTFQILPAGGYVAFSEDPIESLRVTLLPALVLGFAMAAFLGRVVRSSMLEILRQDFLVVAKSKGLPVRTILLKHALRNAAAPIITLIGLQIAFLISGSVIIEEVFVRPGLGRLLIRSIFQRDYPVVQGITLLFAVIFVTTNLIIDIIRGILDPRVGEAERLGK
jgi:peptide/nickel transport system permease protein